MIKEVLAHYFPEWDPPTPDFRGGWVSCTCPVHADENPSAGISYEENRFRCHGCGYGGDYLDIIMGEEDCSFNEANAIAERLAETSGATLPRSLAGVSSKRVPKPARFSEL